MKNKLKAILLVIILVLSMTACTEVAETYDEPAPYANMEEMDDFNNTFSRSAWGSKFGDVKISITWETDEYQWAEYEDCYLEYAILENDIYERVKPSSELAEVQDVPDVLGSPDNLIPYEKQRLKVDLDSYYDFCDVGYYRLAIVYKVKPYSGKLQERVGYIGIGGDDPSRD